MTLPADARGKSESRYRLLFERNPVAMWLYDLDSERIIEGNAAAIEQYGFSLQALSKMTLRDLRPSGGASTRDEVSTNDEPGAQAIRVERHRTMSLTEIDVEIRRQPLGAEGLGLAVCVDVTDRLAAERVAHDAEARAAVTTHRLETLVDAAPQAMVVIDRDWLITRWNFAAEALFGWTSEEVVGKRLPILPEEDNIVILAEQAKIGRARFTKPVERVRLHKDGTRIQVLAASAPLFDADENDNGFVVLYADLRERKLLEEQLRQSQKMEAIGTLAGGVAHDFNNILTVISSYSNMLLTDDRYPDIRPDVEEIATAARRATGLTRQLLTFSRKAIVQTKQVNVSTVVNEIEPMIRRLLMENITLVAKVHEVPCLVIADPSQLEQIIMNLVVNASDAMPEGGTLVVETNCVELDEPYADRHAGVRVGSYVLLAITDTGVGMDAETVRRIFEPFFTTKEVGRGTGLGLATVYAIVQQLGGHVWVYSEPGHGTVFKIYLPREMGSLHPDENQAAAVAATGTGTVLLVEDDDSVRKATRRMLERAGFVVLEASDGIAALAVAKEYEDAVDVVVTDLMMPNMNGGDLAQALEKTHPQLRVVFTSGYTDDTVLRRGLVNGSHRFIHKPFTAEQITRTIAALLAGEDHPA